ncbi:MAG: hypothetical protein ACKOC5_15910 [Chloroflexota bacterium]
MNRRVQAPLLAMIAIASGLIVLAPYFIDLPLLTPARVLLVDWATLLAGAALLVGVLNLARVHWKKVRTGQPGLFYSLVLLLSLVVTLVVGLVFGLSSAPSVWIYQNLLLPVESSLLALLAVVLVFAVGRMLYRRANLFTLVFAATVLVLLLTTFFLGGVGVPGVTELRVWLLQAMATAGARGILLGVALGSVTAGLRVLMGADRPYGG